MSEDQEPYTTGNEEEKRPGYELAQFAYNAYCGSSTINWYSKYSKSKLPPFENIDIDTQDAWITTALAISQKTFEYFVSELMSENNEKIIQEIQDLKLNTKDKLTAHADLLDKAFNGLGFCLLVFEFNKAGMSNYISNAKRESIIEALEETVTRLKNNQDSNKIVDLGQV